MAGGDGGVKAWKEEGESEESAFSQKPSTSSEITKKELREKLLFSWPHSGALVRGQSQEEELNMELRR